MVLNNEQRKMLQPYEEILHKMCFNSKHPYFVGYDKSNEMAEIYSSITGKSLDCKGCDGKVWIKRLSYWYCGNRDGVLPVSEDQPEKEDPKKKGRKPKTEKQ